jgi:glutamyl-Q tRNA(Asp) synthetase
LPRSSTGIATSAESPDRSGTPAAPTAGAYRGRFAPSPTGPLHFGSLLAAAGSWLDARAAGGRWLLRIEDIDPPREPPGAADEILRTLEAFELHWDEAVLYQSRRREAFDTALKALVEAGWVYPCGCSRKDIAAANRALGRSGARTYPGTCRKPGPAARRSRVLRVRTTPELLGMHDRLQGEFRQQLELEVGDFVVRRREGYIAYQLAVVVDDAAQGVTDVVRGVDLLDSTPRQLWLQQLLGLPAPRYMHLPVVATPGGEKLSKQTGAEALDPRRAGMLAWRVLQCLEQAPPAELEGAPPGELWAWGAANWRPQQLAGSRSIPMPRRL